MIVEFSPRMMQALSYLSKHLTDSTATTSLPTINTDGTQIKSIRQLATALGVDDQTASVYVLEAKDHPLVEQAMAQFGIDYFGTASVQRYANRLASRPQTKRVRIVQTVIGARRFGQPRGSIIVDDGEEPLRNLVKLTNDIPGYDKVADQKGQVYYIGEEANRWVVRDPNNPRIKLYEGKSDKDAFRWLDEYATPTKKKKK